jgi:plasmid stability protein
MAVLTIRNLDDHLKNALRVRAAEHGVSMEEEVRRILRHTLEPSSPRALLGDELLAAFGPARTLARQQGLDEGIPLPKRLRPRQPPKLG